MLGGGVFDDEANRCWNCNELPRILRDGQRQVSACGRCREARYCSRECQKEHWKSHKAVCRSGDAATASEPRAAARADDKPYWGGEVNAAESLEERLQRVLRTPTEAGRYASRFAKAQELFRLGLQCFFGQDLGNCSRALVEALLTEEGALTEVLALVSLEDGPSSCAFGRIVSALHEAPKPQPGVQREIEELRLALLETQWLDMQMILARELCERAQERPQQAEVHQKRWFDMLLEMDDLARRAVAKHGQSASSDRRILSRLTLLQMQYGGNPPISRPPEERARLAEAAVALWPEDVTARLWCGRPEDIHALLGTEGAPGLLELDAPQVGKLRALLRGNLDDSPSTASE